MHQSWCLRLGICVEPRNMVRNVAVVNNTHAGKELEAACAHIELMVSHATAHASVCVCMHYNNHMQTHVLFANMWLKLNLADVHLRIALTFVEGINYAHLHPHHIFGNTDHTHACTHLCVQLPYSSQWCRT